MFIPRDDFHRGIILKFEFTYILKGKGPLIVNFKKKLEFLELFEINLNCKKHTKIRRQPWFEMIMG